MGTIKNFEDLAIWKMSREIKNMYYIAEDQQYISFDEASFKRSKAQRLINSLSSFMKYLKPKAKIQ